MTLHVSFGADNYRFVIYDILINCFRVFFICDLQETESEEDILDEGDDDVEEEHDNEPDVPVHPEPEVKKSPEVPAVPKEAERQLSKKERKKKELAELEALLADFGVAQKEGDGQDDSRGNCGKPSALDTYHGGALKSCFHFSFVYCGTF